MARNSQPVRRNIATNAAFYATRILDDLRALNLLRDQKVQLGADGDFIDGDFTGTDIEYLNPNTVGGVLDVGKDMLDWLDAADTIRLEYFLEARKG